MASKRLEIRTRAKIWNCGNVLRHLTRIRGPLRRCGRYQKLGTMRRSFECEKLSQTSTCCISDVQLAIWQGDASGVLNVRNFPTAQQKQPPCDLIKATHGCRLRATKAIECLQSINVHTKENRASILQPQSPLLSASSLISFKTRKTSVAIKIYKGRFGSAQTWNRSGCHRCNSFFKFTPAASKALRS